MTENNSHELTDLYNQARTLPISEVNKLITAEVEKFMEMAEGRERTADLLTEAAFAHQRNRIWTLAEIISDKLAISSKRSDISEAPKPMDTAVDKL